MSTARRTPRRPTGALVALVIAAGALGAQAADLDYQTKRYGSAYDDPRYADLYGDGPTRPPQPERHYAAPYRAHPPAQYGYAPPPIPREPVYRDHEPRYDHRRYAETEPRYRAYSSGPQCLHRDQIRHGLERDGWHDFRDPQVIDQGTALLSARRNGRLFQLKIDRCSGDVLTSRPLEGYRPYADYGYRPYRAY
jgi:hypothetical protein